MIFVDTGAWFARFVSDDPDHARVEGWFSANHEPLITTDYCVDETLTLLVARKRPKLALEAGRAFFHEELAELHFLTPDEVRRAWIVFQTRYTAGWSFTDCTSKIVMDSLGVGTAVALDQHFRQAGAVVVP